MAYSLSATLIRRELSGMWQVLRGLRQIWNLLVYISRTCTKFTGFLYIILLYVPFFRFLVHIFDKCPKITQ